MPAISPVNFFNTEELMKIQRLCIYPKDIQCITGKSERTARRMLADVKIYFGKQPHHLITAEEFAEYAGLDPELVKEYLLY